MYAGATKTHTTDAGIVIHLQPIIIPNNAIRAAGKNTFVK